MKTKYRCLCSDLAGMNERTYPAENFAIKGMHRLYSIINSNERIAVFDRCGLIELNVKEVVGHDVKEENISHVPDDFQSKYIEGCTSLIFVGASKVDVGGPTMHVDFSQIEDIAREKGIKKIYRVANFGNEPGVRQGSNYQIKEIELGKRKSSKKRKKCY